MHIKVPIRHRRRRSARKSLSFRKTAQKEAEAGQAEDSIRTSPSSRDAKKTRQCKFPQSTRSEMQSATRHPAPPTFPHTGQNILLAEVSLQLYSRAGQALSLRLKIRCIFFRASEKMSTSENIRCRKARAQADSSLRKNEQALHPSESLPRQSSRPETASYARFPY